MAQTVYLSDKNVTIDFPDGMSPSEMESAIKANFYNETDKSPDLETTFAERENYRLKKGQATVSVGKAYWNAMNGATSLDVARQIESNATSDFTPENEEKFKPSNILERFAGATTELAPYMFDSSVQGMMYGEMFGAAGATAAIVGGQAGPQIATPEEVITAPVAYLGGRMIGQTWGTWENAAKVEGGHVYKELINDGVDHETAKAWASPAGYLIGAIELLEVGQLFGKFLPKQRVKDLVKVAAKKGLLKNIGSISTKLAKRLTMTTSAEVAEEEAQDIVGLVAKFGAHMQYAEDENREYSGPNFEEAKNQLKDTLIQSLYGFPLLGLPGSVYTTMKSHGREAHMQKVASAILTQRAEQAKANDLAPIIEEATKYNTFQEFTNNVAVDIDDKNVNSLGFDNKMLMMQTVWDEACDIKNEDSQIKDVMKEDIAQSKNITKEAKPATPEQKQGRINFLESEQKKVTQEIDNLLADKKLRESEGKPTNAIELKIKSLQDQNDTLDAEMGDLITSDDIKLSTQKIQIQARKLDKIANDAKNAGVTEGKLAERKINKKKSEAIANIKKDMVAFAKVILPKSERGEFISAVSNVRTKKQLDKHINRMYDYANAYDKRRTVHKIKRQVQKIKASKSIAVEYVQKILDLVNSYELQGHNPDTMKRLEETKKYVEQNGSDSIPNRVLKELEILFRKPLSEIDNATLLDISNKVDSLAKLGKTKLRSRRAAEKIIKANDLISIKKDSKKIESRKIKEERPGGLGDKINSLDNFMNGVKSALNKAQAVDLSISPMDVVFDLIDGVKNYTGANYRIFKKRVDNAYYEYLSMKFDIQGRMDKLANDLNLDNKSMERIGIYAAAQQEGGIDKLEASGISQKDIDSIVLTDNEIKLYESMQKELSNLRPKIEEVMRVVYNQPLGEVKNYFPFMMDFDAMSDKEIRDRFGDSVEQFGKALRKNVEMGATKKRVGGKNKIKLNAYDVFMKHIDNAAYLVTVGRETKYLGELAATDEYLDAVGDVGQEVVRDWVDLVARKGKTADGRNRALDMIRKYTGLVSLGFKLGSALVQVTALMDGAALVGVEYAFGGFKNILTDSEWRKFIKENFPEYRNRIGDDPAFNGFDGDGFYEKLGRAGMWGLQAVDKLTAAGVLAGAYKKACNDMGIEVEFNNPNKQAILEATRMMRRTQSSNEFKDLPSAYSRGGLTGSISVDKLLLQFQSFMLNRWSLIKHDAFRAGIVGKNKKQAINIAMWLIAANFAEIGIRRLTKEMIAQLTGKDLPEDDDEKSDTKMLLQVASNIPFIGQWASSFIYGGLPVPSASTIGKIIGRVGAAINEDDEDVAFKKWSKAFVSALPGGQQLTELIPED